MNKQKQNKIYFEWLKNSSLVFGSILFLLMIIEICLRLLGLSVYPNFHTNSFSINKDASIVRILCIGESTTTDPIAERSYPKKLEKILNEKDKARKYQVFDAGIPGTSSDRILAQLPHLLALYNPHIVISMLGINDHWAQSFDFNFTKMDHFIIRIKNLRLVKLFQILYAKVNQKYFQQNPLFTISQRRFASQEKEKKLITKIKTAASKSNSHYELAYHYLKNNQLEVAKKEFQAITQQKKRSPMAYLGLAMEARAKNNYTQALKYFTIAIKQGKNIRNKNQKIHRLSVIFRELATLYVKQEQTTKAINAYKKSLSYNPRNHNSRTLLASLYKKLGMLDQAHTEYKLLAKYNPNEANFYRAYGAISNNEIKDINWGTAQNKKDLELNFTKLNSSTRKNYLKIADWIQKKQRTHIIMQYPLRKTDYLKATFKNKQNIIYISNMDNFKSALGKMDYRDIFRDSFAGDFGHSTHIGNQLIAENVAKKILQMPKEL